MTNLKNMWVSWNFLGIMAAIVYGTFRWVCDGNFDGALTFSISVWYKGQGPDQLKTWKLLTAMSIPD